MEQRPLRLGDIVDDYCPRERRITNHVIVAIVEDAIRQTRCSTCDAEHVYKEAREPRRRRKVPEAVVMAAPAAGPEDATPAQFAAGRETGLPTPLLAVPQAPAPAVPVAGSDHGRVNGGEDAGDEGASPGEPVEDAWPAHRRLIRATLPRVEGEPPPPRPIPEFTMHQRPPSRGQHAGRHARGWNGQANGNVAGRTGFGGPGPRSRDEPGRAGQGAGRPGRRRGKKRPR